MGCRPLLLLVLSLVMELLILLMALLLLLVLSLGLILITLLLVPPELLLVLPWMFGLVRLLLMERSMPAAVLVQSLQGIHGQPAGG